MNQSLYIYQKISAEIIELITQEKLKTGDKAPSVNDIRSNYKISHITALRVLQELAKNNYLEFVPGKGYYVKNNLAGAKTKTKGLIACITRTFREARLSDNYFNEINQGIQNEVMFRNFNVIYPFCNRRFRPLELIENAIPEILNTIKDMKDDVDGFIFDERIPDNAISEIMNHINNPFVLVNRASPLPIDSVCAANSAGAEKGAEFALKMNYTHFILCKGLPHNSNHKERIDSFLGTLSKNHVPEGNIDFIEGIYSQPVADTASKLRKILKSRESDKKFIFAVTDSGARTICDILKEGNIEPGKDIGLLGFEGMGYAKMMKPYITTIETYPEKIGGKAVDILIGRINNSYLANPGNCTIDTNLYFGETI